MRSLTFLLLFLATSLLAFGQYNSDNLKVDFNRSLTFTFENLRIYPITANDAFRYAHKDLGEFTVLKEAIEKKKILISEIEGGGSVQTLFAENVSGDSIFVMAGEVVTGGKQDRVIAQDFVLAPGEKRDLSAFCVEHGRWSGGSEFDGYFNVSGVKVREAATKNKNQSEVWENVAIVNDHNSAATSTGSYQALKGSDKYQGELEKYLEHFQSAFDSDSRVIGVVVASGDKIVGCDLFANHDLFKNAYNNLLHSYITEAITSGDDVSVKDDDIEDYLNEILADESNQDKVIQEKGALFKYNNIKFHITTF